MDLGGSCGENTSINHSEKSLGPVQLHPDILRAAAGTRPSGTPWGCVSPTRGVGTSIRVADSFRGMTLWRRTAYVVFARREPDHRGTGCDRPRCPLVIFDEEDHVGGQLHRKWTIGAEQDHLHFADLHRGQRALTDGNSPTRRATHFHRAPADL